MSYLNAIKQCKVSEEPLGHFVSRTKPDWLVEFKYDGHRTVLDIGGCIVDAEKIYEDGKVGSLYKVLSGGKDKISFIAFDLLVTPDEGDVSARPLHWRHERLQLLVNELDASKRVMLPHGIIATNLTEIRAFFQKAIMENYEGIVVKPLASTYGDLAWVKHKLKLTADVVVLGITQTKSFKRTGIPHSFLIGYWDPEINKFRRYGRVGAAEGRFDWKVVGEVLLETKTVSSPELICVKPWLVLEIAYGQALPNTFREPRIVRWRRDKLPKDCTMTWKVKA